MLVNFDYVDQGRTSNKVNEITDITTSGSLPLWTTPAYDDAGNTTSMPQPATPTDSYTAVYDAWNRLVSLSDTGGTAEDAEVADCVPRALWPRLIPAACPALVDP